MNSASTLVAARFDLAAGFAACAVSWARAGGAAPQALAALEAAAARVSLDSAEGHACTPLAELAASLGVTAVEGLRADLLASGMVAKAGSAQTLPLVLDAADRLYLQRYHDYELRLARAVLRRAASPFPGIRDIAALRRGLDEFFGPAHAGDATIPDWQRIAVALAMERRLVVVSGGPGTGKTSTVAALLACMLQEQPQARIALAAPTGKAAARMLEALKARSARMPDELRQRLPSQAHTVHRLLGATPQPGRFRHHAGNLLPLDALVVDEASMLDLALAVHLLEAVPDDARLVLLGDKDQLAAVEAGAVFAELSANPALTPPCIGRLAAATGVAPERICPPPTQRPSVLNDSALWLTQSHRFGRDSGIGRLAAQINAGAGEAALAYLAAGGDASLTWIDDSGAEPSAAARQRIADGYAEYMAALRRDATDIAAAFGAFNRFRVLCAIRETPRGIDAMNAMIGAELRAALDHDFDPGPASPWYPGRPVMILRNDYGLKLFNGDVGICLPDRDGELAVWFDAADGSLRRVPPPRLPAHDTAFAATVHKSQGSEYAAVLLLLPSRPVRVMARELLYTAVTRASEAVVVAGSAEVFRAACSRVTVRHGGLIDRMAELAGRPADATQAAGPVGS